MIWWCVWGEFEDSFVNNIEQLKTFVSLVLANPQLKAILVFDHRSWWSKSAECFGLGFIIEAEARAIPLRQIERLFSSRDKNL
jgi:hypothetical protein